MQQHNQIEIARLKQEIEDAYLSAQSAMNGISIGASHAFITKRMESMCDSAAKLRMIAGDEVMRQVLMGL